MDFDKRLKVIFEEFDTGFQSVTEQEANNFLQKEANQYKQPQLVYTKKPSDSPDGDFLIVEPLNRELDYKGRYHALIIDSFEKWEEFPQRGNGIVGTTDTEGEGDFYVVIPENGATMGISAKKRIMDSFSNVSINLGIKFDNFNNALNLLLNIFNNPEGTYESSTRKLLKTNLVRYDGDYDTFKNAVEKVDDDFSSNETHGILSDIVSHPYNKQTENDVISLIEYIKAQGETLSFILDQIFDPYENGFELISFEKFISGDYRDRDVWLDNRCLLVKESAVNGLNFSYETEETPEQPQNDQSEPENLDNQEKSV